MRSYIKKLLADIPRTSALFISLLFFGLSLLFSTLHYTGDWYGNPLSLITWLFAVGFLIYSFVPPNFSLKKYVIHIRRVDLFIALFIVMLYCVTHLWNFSSAPWNQNGLFDDAAWDIYFAKNHSFNGPFQSAFFDEIGYISREVVFHYYISFFFKLFGYNLLVFNISLLILGFTTVLFTTLLIHKMFKDIQVTVLSAIILNFFPLHYMHIFMGHRYAIAAPLMMVSLYFLYTAFTKVSFTRALLSAFFAALCWDSAIMGKQYITALAIAGLAMFFGGEKKWRSKDNIRLSVVWVIGFIISAMPLWMYIIFNYQEYTNRERGLLAEFLNLYKRGGIDAIRPYIDGITELFFAKHTFKRQFLSDFLIIPLTYYLFLIPGLCIAFIKRRFDVLLLSFIPTIGAFLGGAYDFRVLLSVPTWVIAMAFFLNFLKNKQSKVFGISIVVLLFGLIPSISYIWRVSQNPNYLYLLPHKDVAVSRLVQDVMAGAHHPTSQMKKDEFNRHMALPSDTFFCPLGAYAIAHLYLQNHNEKKVLSFCDQGIQLLKTPTEILQNNINAISSYEPQGKDLQIIWEVSEKSQNIIEMFRPYKKFGSEKIISETVDGNSFSLYVLIIKSENIIVFQQEVLQQLTRGALL